MVSFRSIDPYDDPRVTHEFATLNGRKYHYVQGLPQGLPKATILCIHGFPDLWYSWRHIIPSLLSLGLRVIVPDMLGYGQTDAPTVPPEKLAAYSWKSSADAMAELMKQLNIPKVILLGHDWGGVLVYRIYFWHPELVTHIASLCTPYNPPIRENLSLEEVVRKLPTFTYQLSFVNPQTEEDLQEPGAISRFLRSIHRGTRDEMRINRIQVQKSFMKSLGDQPRSSLMSERDLDYYVAEYSRNGMHGPLNWYKIREVNYEDEKNLPKEKDIIKVPVLWVAATHDLALPPSMGAQQSKYIKNLTTHELPSSHWIMEEFPDETNAILKEWIQKVCLSGRSKL